MPGESRSALVRRLLDAAFESPEWTPPAAAAPDLLELGLLDDDPLPTAPPPVAEGAAKDLLRALFAYVGPSVQRRVLLRELRRAVDELLAERG